MIVVANLRGGLGNQMFQLAVARRVAAELDFSLAVMTEMLEPRRGAHGPRPRPYGLGMFRHQPPRVTFAQLGAEHPALIHLVQTRRGFHPGVLDIRARVPIVIDGYWTSESYFAPAAELVRRDFELGEALLERTELTRQIADTMSVGIHVRRGDYLEPNGAHLGPAPLDYYAAAIDRMLERVAAPHLFVFSDDIAWCRANLALTAPHTFVDRTGTVEEAAEREFVALSQCKHHIIANSTFSWWAAWLAPAADKVTIAPRRWFHGIDEPCDHIIPARWLRV
jgi:hypothetical protein